MSEAHRTLSPSITRRNLLTGMAAALTISTAAAASTMLPGPEDEAVSLLPGTLETLRLRWKEAQRAFDAATDMHEAACAVAREDYPVPPDHIRRGKRGAVGTAAVLTDDDINGHVTALVRTWGDENRARRWAEDRLQQRDQYLLSLDVIDASYGVAELADAMSQAADRLEVIEADIMSLPPASLAVVALKFEVWRTYAHLTPKDSFADAMVSRVIADIGLLASGNRAIEV